jgi:outer membrane lipase/esterase
MIFSSKAIPRWLTAVAALAGLAALTLTASCGGGTTQQEVFVPQRLLVFGDDTSVIAQNGRKYSVNGLTTAGDFDCTLEPIWVQQLAAIYGFSFAECNPGAVADPKARMLAGVGAKVSDVSAQVEAQVAAGGFRDKDLATMLAGANDVLELYRQFPSLSEATLINEAGARGRRLAEVVNRLVGMGVKVVVADLPDISMTPYALNERALGGSGFDRAALIKRLTVAFNEQLGVKIVLDGRFVGLVQSQLRFEEIARFPGNFGLSNITQPICTAALPECTTATLVANAAPGQYLWADETRLSSGGHAQLAALAIDRAQRNPF